MRTLPRDAVVRRRSPHPLPPPLPRAAEAALAALLGRDAPGWRSTAPPRRAAGTRVDQRHAGPTVPTDPPAV